MGGIVGWIASMIMGNNAQQGIILNVVVGIVGALLGGWLIGPLLGAIVLGTAQEVARVTISSEMNLLILGVLLIFFVIVAPQGFVGLARKYLFRRNGR